MKAGGEKGENFRLYGAYDNSYITVFCTLPTLTAGMYGRPFLGYDVAAELEIP